MKKSPNKGRVHSNLGNALQAAKRYEEAIVAYENGLKRNPNLIGAATNLATIHIDRFKDYEKAEAYLLAVLERAPDYVLANLNLGVIALNRGEHDPSQREVAIQLFQKVLRVDPKNRSAHSNLAACYLNRRDFSKALQTLDRGLAYWPASHQLYVLKGRAHLMSNDRSLARQNFAKALALRPDDPEVRRWYSQLN